MRRILHRRDLDAWITDGDYRSAVIRVELLKAGQPDDGFAFVGPIVCLTILDQHDVVTTVHVSAFDLWSTHPVAIGDASALLINSEVATQDRG